jgi:hypothetical protein
MRRKKDNAHFTLTNIPERNQNVVENARKRSGACLMNLA